jgi:hypothetical protein
MTTSTVICNALCNKLRERVGLRNFGKHLVLHEKLCGNMCVMDVIGAMDAVLERIPFIPPQESLGQQFPVHLQCRHDMNCRL